MDLTVRPIVQADKADWRFLFDGYNAFYGRSGDTALASEIVETTWERFFDDDEPVFALVAEQEGKLVGLVQYLFHRSTTAIQPSCYLQDLFTLPEARGRGVGRALIQAVYEKARQELNSLTALQDKFDSLVEGQGKNNFCAQTQNNC